MARASAGVATFLVVGLSWYVVMVLEHRELFGRFLVHEVVGRFTSDEFHRNPQWYGGFLVYGAGFLLGALPWSIPFFLGVARRIRAGWVRARLRSYLAREEDLFLCCGSAFLAVFLLAPRLAPILPLFVPCRW
jgi:hypothetical protein